MSDTEIGYHKIKSLKQNGKKVDFEVVTLKENLDALLVDLQKAKPSTSKGVYMRRVTVSSTMGPGVSVDQATLLSV